MSVYQSLVCFDKLFNQLKEPPIIVNDLIDSSEEDKERIKNHIFTKFSSDMLSSLPSCDCGDIKGTFNVGVLCGNCNTVVSSSLDQAIEPILWMRAPKGVKKLINPTVWYMLSERFTRSGFNVIQWICDSTYRTNVKIPPALNDVQIAGISRGYNYFVDNFFYIIDTLYSLKTFKQNKDGPDYLRELLYNSKDAIFSDYLPLPNKAILIIDETNVGTYVDPIVTGAIDAIQTITGIDSSLSQHSVRVKENRTIKAIDKLAEFYVDYYKNSLAKKSGIFRKHIFGSRSHFSFRTVISSLTDPHDHREIHIPWPVATSVFRIHLINKLTRLGQTVNQAIEYLNQHAYKYSDLLNNIFIELINESPNQGIDCLCQR